MISEIREMDDFFMSYMPANGSTGSIRDARLDRMHRLLSFFGNPEKHLRIYHIAGSKGKGTTAEMLSKLLTASGKKTGLFLSPHVYDLRERFTLSGVFFKDEEYINALNALSLKLDEEKLGFKPTTFELYTLYAYLLFFFTGCRYAVMETGMGGRLDATNTITPLASILMPIELEHTNVLGSTIREIATEKSKIIKPGRPVYIAMNTPDALEVFSREAEENNSKAHLFSKEIQDFSYQEEEKTSTLSFKIDGREIILHPSLHSKAIAENMALAVLIAENEGFLTKEGLKALERLTMPGRFEERMIEGKKVIFEVAHTLNSVKNALESFKKLYGNIENTCCIFGSVEGKDYRAMTDEIMKVFDNIVITTPGTFKKAEPGKIYDYVRVEAGIHKKTTLIENPHEAFDFAFEMAEVILVIGSFYLVGQFGERNA